MKIFILTVIFLVQAPIFAGPTKTKEARGKFVKIAMGDYGHLVIKENGKERSFWIYSCKPLDCEAMEAKPANYIGKTLIVKYQTKKVFVQEAGEEVVQDQTVSVSFGK